MTENRFPASLKRNPRVLKLVPSYLVSQPCGYRFRIKVPPDLQPLVSLKEVRYSLRTGFQGEAKFRARTMASIIQRLFRDLRKDSKMRELTPAEIKHLIDCHLKEAVESIEYGRVMNPRISEEGYDDKHFILSSFIGEYTEQLALNDYRPISSSARVRPSTNKLNQSRVHSRLMQAIQPSKYRQPYQESTVFT